MKASFYSGASGLIAHQEALNTIGHNMANVNTVGYKSQQGGFEPLLQTEMYVNSPEEPLSGNGVRYTDVGMRFLQGSLRQTDNPLDFSVVGNALFAVEELDGSVSYTRNGMFSLAMDGDGAELVTADGAYVLDNDGEHISVEPLEDGAGFDLSTLREQIGLYSFTNPAALQGVSNNRYVASETSGEATVVEEDARDLRVGAYEMSQTSLTDEMADLIAAQRAYQVSARVVQTSDEVEQLVSSLRR